MYTNLCILLLCILCNFLCEVCLRYCLHFVNTSLLCISVTEIQHVLFLLTFLFVTCFCYVFVVFCCVLLCFAMFLLCFAVFCYVLLCYFSYVLLCFVVFCCVFVMFCYVFLLTPSFGANQPPSLEGPEGITTVPEANGQHMQKHSKT